MTPSKTTPLISLVISGRNDGFVGDYEWRIQTAFDYLASNLKKLGRLEAVELVFMDWGSEIPLYSKLSLGDDAKRLIRFYQVPVKVGNALGRDSSFPGVLAINAAARRSFGQWIGLTDGDILFTQEFLVGLFDFLEGKKTFNKNPAETLISGFRRHIPWLWMKNRPKIEEIDWAIHRLDWAMPTDSKKGFGGAGLIMMHRELWQESGGYDERLIYFGWADIELSERITGKYSWMDMRDLNLYLFHMGHKTPHERKVQPKQIHV